MSKRTAELEARVADLEGELDFYRVFVRFLADFMASAAVRLNHESGGSTVDG